MNGITVLDLTHFVAGPWCTMLLADLGADVVKVEPPRGGEIGRSMGGVFAAGESAIFLGFNRNKRSVTLDLKTEEGREAVYRLALTADVLVHNLRPETTRRLGVEHGRMLELNPALVYCQISAYGQDGPYAAQPANDPIIQSISGAMLAAASGNGRPTRMGVSLPDFAAGVLAATGVVAALHRRARTGRGGTVDLSLLDAQLFAQTDVLAPVLNGHPATDDSAWSGVYGCRDAQFVYVDAGSADRASWRKVAGALSVEAPSPAASAVAEALGVRRRDEAVRLLLAAGVDCAPVYALPEVLGGATRQTVTTTHPKVGELVHLSTPVTATPPWSMPTMPPPLLGEHTEEVLAEMGFSADAIASLARCGVTTAKTDRPDPI